MESRIHEEASECKACSSGNRSGKYCGECGESWPECPKCHSTNTSHVRTRGNNNAVCDDCRHFFLDGNYGKIRNESTHEKQLKKITVFCRDGENRLEDLLKHIQSIGNSGHSFEIIVDPKGRTAKTFYWDGDGNDWIKKVES